MTLRLVAMRLLAVCLSPLLVMPAAYAQEVTHTFHNLTVNGNLEGVNKKQWPDQLVLITHGTLSANNRSTYRNLQSLLKDEYHLPSLAINLSLGLDNRHGEYDCALPHRHTNTEAMDEIASWLAWLKEKGVKHVTLVGHSRGGNQTAWLLSEKPHPMVSGAVLMAPSTWNKNTVDDNYKDTSDTAFHRIYQKAKVWIKEGHGDHLLKHVNFLHCKGTDVEARTFVDYYQPDPRFDTPTLLKTIQTPVLVLIGSDDTVVPDLAQKMAAVHNPNVTTHVIEDAGHFFRDFALEDVAKAINGFVQSHEH